MDGQVDKDLGLNYMYSWHYQYWKTLLVRGSFLVDTHNTNLIWHLPSLFSISNIYTQNMFFIFICYFYKNMFVDIAWCMWILLLLNMFSFVNNKDVCSVCQLVNNLLLQLIISNCPKSHKTYSHFNANRWLLHGY